ncbi:hypothetical protein HMPREF1986_01152 [Oribacterium sp. oral taxon 078 str. F0263]|nr:hypothetical protein HMPREF1986_01152 [Oribacterium sp. oral taxon 078 str. F0263]
MSGTDWERIRPAVFLRRGNEKRGGGLFRRRSRPAEEKWEVEGEKAGGEGEKRRKEGF